MVMARTTWHLDPMTKLRDAFEASQIAIYFGAIIAALGVALMVPGVEALEAAITPALAVMLFVTFLQVPLRDLGQALGRVRFLAALLITNFVAIPLLAALLVQVLPPDPLVRLGVLLVLLTPCIDYVVTFSHLGRANARLLLAATPLLLIVQLLLLPVYLRAFLGEDAARLVQPGPFLHAFLWLIVVPLLLAVAVQIWAGRSRAGAQTATGLGVLPVPATAVVLFVVIAAVVPQLGEAGWKVARVVPVYVAFAVAAPLIGWGVGRLFRLDAPTGRALAFSAATRNSLVVLPLAFAVPDAAPLLPAIIVAQTLVELASELAYVRLVPKLGAAASTSLQQS